jgi:hypothetical protein
MEIKLTIWLHPHVNKGEILGIYEMETKHSNQFRASNTWEMVADIEGGTRAEGVWE